MIYKELGVEVEEEWVGNDGNTYKFKEDGTLYMTSMCATVDVNGYKALLTGKLKPVWQPKEHGLYCVPDINWENEGDRYLTAVWLNDSIDQFRLKNNLVFGTRTEAIERANEILKVLKNE